MTGFNFVGNLDGLSEKQKEYIIKIFEEKGFKSGDIEASAVGKVGDNYVAQVKRFAIENNGETFKVVAKVAPANEAVRITMQANTMFHNEIVMYTDVLPKFTQLEIEAGIPEKERLRYAKCYGATTEAPYEMIVLEDLQESNYMIFDRFSYFSNDIVKLVLKNFAFLHALSFALKYKEPEVYKLFCEKLLNPWTTREYDADIQAYFAQLETDVLSIIENESDKNLVKGTIVDLMPNNVKHKEFVTGSKYSVITQGDSWTNNIMFKVQDKEAIECCMIDYQISNENSPVADIQYMIFNCTDHESRSKYYHEWVTYYHSQLDKRLSKFDLKVELVYPREQLESDLKLMGKISFGLSVMLATMLMRETSEVQTFQDAMQKENNMEEMLNIFKFENMKTNSFNRFKKKLDGLFASFVELGYI